MCTEVSPSSTAHQLGDESREQVRCKGAQPWRLLERTNDGAHEERGQGGGRLHLLDGLGLQVARINRV